MFNVKEHKLDVLGEKKENVHGEVIRCEPGARNMGA